MALKSVTTEKTENTGVASQAVREFTQKKVVRKGKVFKARAQEREENDYHKILGYGEPGMGKTRAIKAFLLAGLKVWVLSSDMGGSGLKTVKQELTREGHWELLRNLKELEIAEYKDVGELLDVLNDAGAAQAVTVETEAGETGLWDWDPDVLVWEGFGNFQTNDVVNYVLESTSPGYDKVSDARVEGLRAELQDYDSIKRGTIKYINDFLRTHNPVTGKMLHKYVTMHENAPKEGEVGSKAEVMLTGAARKSIAGGFDLVIRMSRRTVRDDATGEKKPEYMYDIETARATTKARGYDLPPTMKADMGEVWRRINTLGEVKGA